MGWGLYFQWLININRRNRERKYHYYVHSVCALQFITLVLHKGRTGVKLNLRARGNEDVH